MQELDTIHHQHGFHICNGRIMIVEDGQVVADFGEVKKGDLLGFTIVGDSNRETAGIYREGQVVYAINGRIVYVSRTRYDGTPFDDAAPETAPTVEEQAKADDALFDSMKDIVFDV